MKFVERNDQVTSDFFSLFLRNDWFEIVLSMLNTHRGELTLTGFFLKTVSCLLILFMDGGEK